MQALPTMSPLKRLDMLRSSVTAARCLSTNGNVHQSQKVYDVAVIGGGVMGSWAAIRAAQKGASVVLADRYEADHTFGSSHGDGRIYRFAYEEKYYIDMMSHALPMWQQLQDFAGSPIMATTGGVNISARDCKIMNGVRSMYQRQGIEHELLDSTEMKHRFPQFHLNADQVALYQPDFGVLFATKCIIQQWRFAESLGVQCVTGFAMDSMQQGKVNTKQNLDSAELITITSECGRTIQCRSLVMAPGAWLSTLSKKLFNLDIPTRVSAETVCYFAPMSDTIDHSYKSMPVFIPHEDNGLGDWGYYGLPSIDIPGIKASAHYCGPTIDPSERPQAAGGWKDLSNTDEGRRVEEEARQRVDEVIESTSRQIRKMFPHVEPDPFETVSCLYTTTPDHDFILGKVPGHERVILAGGGSGHGFKMGPAIGDLAASLALCPDESPALDVEKFKIERLLGVDAATKPSGSK